MNGEVIETKSRGVPEIVINDQEYLRTRRKSLDDGLILSLRGHRQSSGDSGIDRFTGGETKPNAIRRLSLFEGSSSMTSLPTVEKRKNSRNRNFTSNSAKSSPETPRMSLDFGFLNGSTSLTGIGRRRNTATSMFHDNSSVFDDEATPEEEKRKHLW